MRQMREAITATGSAEAAGRAIFERLGPLAHHMVNEGQDVPREPLGDMRLD